MGFRHGRINRLKNNGMKNNVRIVETVKPHTMEAATGPHNRECPPRPVARENNPAIVVRDVISIGMTRLLDV